MVSKTYVRSIMRKYREAWEEQNPEKIIAIFTKNGTYHERPHAKPFRGRPAIKKYWQDNVADKQRDVKFKLKKIFVDGNNAVVEWEAKSWIVKKRKQTHMKGIAVLEIRNGKIKAFREYWHSNSK